jgi:hypothetical protein
MSVKPFCQPDKLQEVSIKTLKGKLYKLFCLLSAKHDTPETAAPFFLKVDHDYSDDKGLLLVFGKINKWKPYIIKAIKDKNATRKGYCYVSCDEKGLPKKLILNTTAGKAKIGVIEKQLKALVGAKFTIEIGPDTVEDPKRDEAVEAMDDTPENAVNIPDVNEGEKQETGGKKEDKKSEPKKGVENLKVKLPVLQDELDKLIKKLKEEIPKLEDAETSQDAYLANKAIKEAILHYQNTTGHKIASSSH